MSTAPPLANRQSWATATWIRELNGETATSGSTRVSGSHPFCDGTFCLAICPTCNSAGPRAPAAGVAANAAGTTPDSSARADPDTRSDRSECLITPPGCASRGVPCAAATADSHGASSITGGSPVAAVGQQELLTHSLSPRGTRVVGGRQLALGRRRRRHRLGAAGLGRLDGPQQGRPQQEEQPQRGDPDQRGAEYVHPDQPGRQAAEVLRVADDSLAKDQAEQQPAPADGGRRRLGRAQRDQRG